MRNTTALLARGRIVAVAAAFALCSAGCGASHGSNIGTKHDRPLRIGFQFDFSSLNPMSMGGLRSEALISLTSGELLRYSPDGRLEPEIAAEVPTTSNGGISADGKTLTYHLRHDVRWQDGARLGARDFVFTARQAVNPRNNLADRDPYDRVADVYAEGDSTLMVRLRKRDAAFEARFFTSDSNVGVLPEHLLRSARDLNAVPYNAAPIGCGPYRVIAWQRGVRVLLKADPHFYLGKPAIDMIELRILPDAETRYAQVRTGEIDAVLDEPTALYDRYLTVPGVRVTSVPISALSLLAFNTEHPIVGDVRVRRGIASLVDAAEIARTVYHGTVRSSHAARALFHFADDASAPWPSFDPAKGTALLDAAGWRRSPSGERRRDGAALVLHMVYPNGSASSRIEAAMLQQELKNDGVALDLQAVEPNEFWATETGFFAAGHFDLALANYGTPFDPDVRWAFACSNRSPSGYNFPRYCSRAVDRFLDDADLAPTIEGRTASLRGAERTIARDVPLFPLFQERALDIVPTALRGFIPQDESFLSVARWSWAPSR